MLSLLLAGIIALLVLSCLSFGDFDLLKEIVIFQMQYAIYQLKVTSIESLALSARQNAVQCCGIKGKEYSTYM